MQRIAAFLMSYMLMAPAFAADTPVLENTEAAVAQTATAVPAPHEGGTALPQFNVETFPTQVFWLAIVFIVTYSLVKMIVIPQIGGTLDARESHITKELQAAGELTEKARLGQSEYETTIRTARQEAQAKLMTAREDISKRFTTAETAQREAFQTQRDAAQNKITAQKDTVVSALESEAKTLAQSLTGKLMETSANKKKAAA